MSVPSRRPNFPAFSVYLTVTDGDAAIAFYEKAFGAKLHYKLTMGENGANIGHAELSMFDTIVMIGEEQWGSKSPLTLGGTSTSFCVYVDDCDAVIKQAVEAGGKLERAAENHFYGDRSGVVKDIFGHKWTISTFIEDVPPEEMQKRFDQMMKTAPAAGDSSATNASTNTSSKKRSADD